MKGRSIWSDVCDLIKQTVTKDSENYEAIIETPRTLMCNFEDGVSQNEFYKSKKAGMRASASLDVWAVDYEGETLVEFNGKRYEVIRAFNRSEDVKTLILSEVIR